MLDAGALAAYDSPCLWTDNKPSRPKGQHPRAKCNKPVKLRPALPNAPNSDRLRGVSRARSPPRPRCHRSVARDDPGARVNRRALWGRISSARSLPPAGGEGGWPKARRMRGSIVPTPGCAPGDAPARRRAYPAGAPLLMAKAGGKPAGRGISISPALHPPLETTNQGGLGHGLRKI